MKNHKFSFLIFLSFLLCSNLFAVGKIIINGTIYNNQATILIQCNQPNLSVDAVDANLQPLIYGQFTSWNSVPGVFFFPYNSTSSYASISNSNNSMSIGFAGSEACIVYLVRLPPPTPTITTSSSLCGIGSSATFSASSDGSSSTTYQWSTTGQVTVNGSNLANTTTNSATVQNNFGGRVYVRFSDACGNLGPYSAPANVGQPTLNTVSDGTFSIGNPINICRNRGHTMFVDNPNASSYTWSVSNSQAYTNFYSPGTQVNFGSSQSSGGSFTLSMFGSNGCGSVSKTFGVVVIQCGFMAFSNPAQNNLKIAFQSPEDAKVISPESIVLYNEKSVEILVYKPELKDQKEFDLDVSKLPRGEYYLHVNFFSKNEKGSVVPAREVTRIRLN